MLTLSTKYKCLLNLSERGMYNRDMIEKDNNPYFPYIDILNNIYIRSFDFITKNEQIPISILTQIIVDMSYFLKTKIFNQDNTLNSSLLEDSNYIDKIFDELEEVANKDD